LPLGIGVWAAPDACGATVGAAPPAGDEPPLYEPQAASAPAISRAARTFRIT
jgi:hypothetical protein